MAPRRLVITFDVDKRGRPIAYRVERDRFLLGSGACLGFTRRRMPIAEARMLVETEEADVLPHAEWQAMIRSSRWQPEAPPPPPSAGGTERNVGRRARRRRVGARPPKPDLERALEHAHRFAAILGKQSGAPRVKVWGKAGIGVRVYFPEPVGFLGVDRGGDLSSTSRGRSTFEPGALYAGWRRAFERAREVYRKDTTERYLAETAHLMDD